MAAYLDTSVLVPLFFNETGTAAARLALAQEPSPWISHWTLAEFASAVAFKLRNGQVSDAVADRARRLFQAFTTSQLTVVDVLREDFANAADLCRTAPAPGLRTPDALHLAVAQRLGLSLVSFDAALMQAARGHGVACRNSE